ncbi:MAG: hypothetical protein ACREP7_06735 [Lysobacter sp.]
MIDSIYEQSHLWRFVLKRISPAHLVERKKTNPSFLSAHRAIFKHRTAVGMCATTVVVSPEIRECLPVLDVMLINANEALVWQRANAGKGNNTRMNVARNGPGGTGCACFFASAASRVLLH